LPAEARSVEQGPTHIVLEVLRTHISQVSAWLLTQFAVADLTIEDPSLESVISQAFAAGTEPTGANR
jgi:ABC-2 type transport system ATP-binding protein